MGFLCCSINNTTSIKELLDVLTHGRSDVNPNPAKAAVSFFGYRVSIPGYWCSVPLLRIIYKVLVLAREKQNAFTPQERVDGEHIIQIIHNLDGMRKDSLNSSSCIKRFFYNVSDFFIWLYFCKTFNTWYKECIDYELFQVPTIVST